MQKVAFFTVLSAIFMFLALSIISIAPVQAQGFDPTNINSQQGFNSQEIPNAFGQTTDHPTDIRIIAIEIIKIILSLLGIIFLVLIIFAGFKYMTAAGNEEQASSARTLIVQAVIGIAIILASYSITVFVMQKITQAAGGHVDNWTEVWGF